MNINMILANNISKRLDYISSDIKKQLDKKEYEKLFVIVPEQFNFACQKTMLEMLDLDVISDIEILSFTRLTHRIYEETNYFKESITNIEREIIIKDILDMLKDKFKFFNKYETSQKMIEEICNVNNLIIRNMIDEEKIIKFYESNHSILSNKLHDVYLIYSEYKKHLEKLDVDLKSYEVLNDIAPNCNMISKSKIYISDFYNFTNEQVEIINILSNAGSSIDIIMQTEEYEKDTNDELNIFNSIYQNIKKFKDAKIINYNNECNTNDDKKSKELTFLDDIYTLKTSDIYQDATEDIYLTNYKTKSSEVLDVAFNIIKLVKDGYRYKDITLVVNEVDNYRLIIEDIMKDFNIPVLIEKECTLYNSKIVRIIEKMMKCTINSFNSSDVISLLKEDEYKNIEKEDVYLLENEMLRKGIKNIDEECRINLSSDIKLLIDFIRTRFNNQNSLTVQEYANAISDFLNDFLDDDFLTEYNSEIDKISKILKVWSNVTDEKHSLIDFYSDFLTFAKDLTIDKVQGKIDEVEVYDKTRTNVMQTKIMMLIGFSDNGTSFGKLTNIFTEKENNLLKSNGMEFNKSYIDLILEQRFLFFNMIDKAEDKIFISYVDNNAGTKVEVDSEVIKIMSKFANLSKLKFTQDEIINNYLINDNAIILFLSKFIGNINKNKDIIEKLISLIDDKKRLSEIESFLKDDKVRIKNENEEIKLSFSSIETYVKCPFEYFIKYMLRVDEREEKQIDARFIGSAVHEVLEKTFRKVINKEIDIEKVTNEEIRNIVFDIVDNSDMFTNELKEESFKDFIDKFKNITLMNTINLIKQLRLGKFEVTYVEEPFGKECTIKGIEFVTKKEKKKVSLSGKIDRVDMYVNNDETYIKVIDYKTGKKNFDLEDIEKGLNIQLIIYLKVLLEEYKNKKVKPAGIFISRINSDMKKDEEISLRDNKYSGLILDDKKVLEYMDIEYRDSNILPIKFKNGSDDYTIYTKNNAVTEDRFNEIIENTLDKVKEIAENIATGIMDVNPTQDEKQNVCDYCLYKTICEKE